LNTEVGCGTSASVHVLAPAPAKELKAASPTMAFLNQHITMSLYGFQAPHQMMYHNIFVPGTSKPQRLGLVMQILYCRGSC